MNLDGSWVLAVRFVKHYSGYSGYMHLYYLRSFESGDLCGSTLTPCNESKLAGWNQPVVPPGFFQLVVGHCYQQEPLALGSVADWRVATRCHEELGS